MCLKLLSNSKAKQNSFKGDLYEKGFKKIKKGIWQKITSLLAPFRRKKLKYTDFSILSNNCWTGKVYQHFGLPYSTPTIGLYFYAEDYIEFLSNYQYYLTAPIRFIKPEESKYFKDLKAKNQLHIPIGKIDCIEILFLHYKTEKEALEKWQRRVSRINFGRLIIKFSYMNNCNDDLIKRFDALNFKTKFAFVNQKYIDVPSSIYIPGYDGAATIKDDTIYYSKYIDLVSLINNS